MKKLLALVLALVMVLGVLAGCTKEPADTKPADTKPAADDTKPAGDDTKPAEKPLTQIWAEAKDVTEIPDWEGDTLTMTCWWQAYSPNGGGFTMKESKENNYTNEIRRITGCEFNAEESFFNNEKTPDEMIAQMVATNDFPDIMETSDQNIRLLGENGYMWDVTEYMPKYAPTYWKYNGPENPIFAPAYQSQIDKYGAIYSFADATAVSYFYNLTVYFPEAYPEIADKFTEEYIRQNKLDITGLTERMYVYVRQDILDQLFPGCNSNETWQALLDEQGYLTEEQILDIPIDTLADFDKMLYDIKAILDAAGDPTVYTFYTHNGTDNWSFFVQHKELWGTQSDYLGYYDIDKGTIVKILEEDWYKDIIAMSNRWIRDGVCSPEAVVDSHEQCKEKIANDKYAVVQRDFGPTYAGNPNPENYRVVYPRYKVSDNELSNLTLAGSVYATEMPHCLGVFNTGAIDTEEKLAQFLMSLEFTFTKAGQLLSNFGTPDLGNYTYREDGSVEMAGELKAYTLSGNNTAKSDYMAEKGIPGASGYTPGGWPGYLFSLNPVDGIFYKPEGKVNVVDYTQNMYALFPAQPENYNFSVSIGIHSLLGGHFLNDVEGFKNFWAARTQWEGMMTKAMVAESEAAFETAYTEMLDFIEECGWDDETMAEMNKMLLETKGLAAELKAQGLPVPEGY